MTVGTIAPTGLIGCSNLFLPPHPSPLRNQTKVPSCSCPTVPRVWDLGPQDSSIKPQPKYQLPLLTSFYPFDSVIGDSHSQGLLALTAFRCTECSYLARPHYPKPKPGEHVCFWQVEDKIGVHGRQVGCVSWADC